MITENMKYKVKEYFDCHEFNNLLEALKNKYINYGSCIGTINITPSTLEEAKKLSGFLSKNIKQNKKINIRIIDIQKALDDSIFEGVLVEDLIFLFYPKIKSKKELKLESNSYITKMMNYYKMEYKNSNIWSLFENKELIKRIEYFILHDNELLKNVLKSLSQLPIYENQNEVLAVFSSIVTGNPHYYDLDTHNSNVFLQFICYLFGYQYEENRTSKKTILENVGILIDEVSNFVITYNLGGCDMLDMFKKHLTPLNINLSNMVKITDIKAENNVLLIVENPSFISKINNKRIGFSVIVTSGNSNFVLYKVLDKMKNVNIYFNGDFDPEGLLIAQNFKHRYTSIKFIGYNGEYYKNGLSNNKITDSRLKKLKNIENEDLCRIKDYIQKERLSSYQEANYQLLLNDIKKIMNEK